jgi:hypothetical protein
MIAIAVAIAQRARFHGRRTGILNRTLNRAP